MQKPNKENKKCEGGEDVPISLYNSINPFTFTLDIMVSFNVVFLKAVLSGSPPGWLKYNNSCVLHQVEEKNAENISDFSAPSALVEYRWRQAKSPCLTFCFIQSSKMHFLRFLEIFM